VDARDLLVQIRDRWGSKSSAGMKATKCINEGTGHAGHSNLSESAINYVYDSVVAAWGETTQQAAADELDHPMTRPTRVKRKKAVRSLMGTLDRYERLLRRRYRFVKKKRKKAKRKAKR
jgi:hypothetical protein